MRLRTLLGLTLGAGVGWLLLAPTRVRPVAWEGPGLVPSRTGGPYADNGRLNAAELFAPVPGKTAPESVAVDAQGRLYSGFEGGAIVRFQPDGTAPEVFADTGGRPLGLRFHPDGSLLIADALRGLLRVGPEGGEVRVLTTSAEGVPFRFTDDLDVDRAGRFVYFTDASSEYGWPHELLDLLEHGGHGRVLRHDLGTGETTVLARGLNFPNGVTLGPDEAYLLVTETGTARVHRLWLNKDRVDSPESTERSEKRQRRGGGGGRTSGAFPEVREPEPSRREGERAGTLEVFADNLPGYPDNVRYDGAGTFWVALPSRRSPLLDATAQRPWLRRVVARIAERAHLPLPEESMLVGLDLGGRPVAFAQGSGPDSYGYITQVLPVGDNLILSSLHGDTLARVPISQVRS
ncbi:strictosidine synthase [Deinococcus aerius]|uniref:Strictosidine synthase n=1 Tax=Deinococcus aerius TaxID=200253 RepID=A0A2I9DMY2_9DEIO|nr:SMP-30/gluconolactonase/LRE family protein [Deinococcus aerius]GBF06391.1 strictosidine synthase [Deinococcus aerius]